MGPSSRATLPTGTAAANAAVGSGFYPAAVNLPARMHHHAWVVADQERTRHFYEDVLGFPLVATWCEVEDLRGKRRAYCHTFFGLADGSALAFFQFADPADRDELRSHRPGSLGHL